MDKDRQALGVIFVIQARMGSVRLPGKILLPAFDGKCILDIITEKLQRHFPDVPVYLATGPREKNAGLGRWAEGKNVRIYWGSEEDVLSRFRELAATEGAAYLVRICADNPFLDMEYIDELFRAAEADPDAEYIAHCVNGTPSIRTHLGIYCEMISARALREKMENLSALNREHVTSYMYGEGRDAFRLAWIRQEWPAEMLQSLRLSVDTSEDMELAAQLYALTGGNALQAAEYVMKNPGIARAMATQIEKFKK